MNPRRTCTLPLLEELEERNLLSVAGVPEGHIAIAPNDSSFGSQYSLNNTGSNGNRADADIDAPEAWNVITGSLKTVVGVVDTGIDYRHPDLYKNIWLNQSEIPSAIRSRLIDIDGDRLITFWDLNDPRNQGSGKITDLNGNGRIDGGDVLKPTGQGGWANGRSDDGDRYIDDLIGWDFLNGDNDPLDDNGHGTHVAGTIGAIGNNGIGVSGVNWTVQLMALKFMGASGSGGVEGAIKAIDYAANHGAFVSNHSWSMGDYYYQPLYDAIARAQQDGHIVVAAAGNGGSDGKSDNNDSKPAYPGSFNLGNIIAVAATGSSDGMATFSNYGVKTVDLGAPGLGILSTYTGDRYISMGGTSMATPHVAGAVALVHSLHPDWSASQVIQQILATTDPIAALRGRTVTGGRLNLARAVGAGQGDLLGPRLVELTPNASGSSPVNSVRVTFSEPIDPATFTTGDVVIAGPNGTVSVTGIAAVAGANNTQFDLTFATQSTPGVYRVTVGPDIRDNSGNRMDQDRDSVNGETSTDRSVSSFTIYRLWTYNLPRAANITDNGASKFTVTVDRDIAIASVKVALVVTHANLGNLRIRLRAPDGTEVVLTNRGASGTNFTWTTFSDDASRTLADSASPYSGSYRPDGAFSDFAGKSARGSWELWIDDQVAGQTGRVYQFRLMIEESPVSVQAMTRRQEVTVELSESVLVGEWPAVLASANRPRELPSELVQPANRQREVANRQRELPGAPANRRRELPGEWAQHTTSEEPTLDELMEFFARWK